MGKFLKLVGVIVKTCVAPRPPPLQGAHWSGSGWTSGPPGPAPTLPGARNPGRAQATLTESEAGSPPSLWNARSTAGFPCLIATACARRGPYGPSLLRQRQGCTEAPRDGTETSARSRLRPPAPTPRPPLRGPLPPRPFPVPAHRSLGALSRRGPSRWSTGGDRGAGETWRAAARLLGAAGGCAPGGGAGGAGGARRWRASCALVSRPKPSRSQGPSSRDACPAPRSYQGSLGCAAGVCRAAPGLPDCAPSRRPGTGAETAARRGPGATWRRDYFPPEAAACRSC